MNDDDFHAEAVRRAVAERWPSQVPDDHLEAFVLKTLAMCGPDTSMVAIDRIAHAVLGVNDTFQVQRVVRKLIDSGRAVLGKGYGVTAKPHDLAKRIAEHAAAT